ncbi:MAG: hypothetical protein JWM27_126 [Gemmatimonadetes bacterium]|nr:hypothetical protein [Gemmatimonadota bacterium]
MSTPGPAIDDARAAVDLAFADVPRPVAFARGTCGCSECLEHEATLASHTRDTIGLAELGNPGWDPICFASDMAFAYYLPALVRLALTTDAYLDQLCFHLGRSGRQAAITREQAAAVLAALWAMVEADRVDACDAPGVEDAIAALEARLAAPEGEGA